MHLLVCTDEDFCVVLGLGVLDAKIITQGVDGFDEAIVFLIGRALRCGKLATESLNNFLEIFYLFV